MAKFEECPKCGGTDAEQMKFTWWGGLLGPKLFTHVKCPDCGCTYNGKTGASNTRNIVIYTLVLGIPIGVIAGYFVYNFVTSTLR